MPGRTTGVVTLKSTVFNQRKELVLEGTQKFLIRRRPAGLITGLKIAEIRPICGISSGCREVATCPTYGP